jgi:hypothetical protein
MGLALFFLPQSLVHGAEVVFAGLFSFLIVKNVKIARALYVIFAVVLTVDVLLMRIDEYTLIFLVAFLIVLYELIDFVDFHKKTTDDAVSHEIVMNAHLRYIAVLFAGCSLIPTVFVVATRLIRFQIGYDIAVNVFIFSVVVLVTLWAVRTLSH